MKGKCQSEISSGAHAVGYHCTPRAVAQRSRRYDSIINADLRDLLWQSVSPTDQVCLPYPADYESSGSLFVGLEYGGNLVRASELLGSDSSEAGRTILSPASHRTPVGERP
jgi:hypothetical protein